MREAPETIARGVLTLCADCDQCRDLLDEAPCQFFPRLFTYADRMKAGGPVPDGREWLDMIDLCNSCGQCPCASIQTRIREAKDAFVARDGLAFGVRLIEDVRLTGRLCGMAPSIANALMRTEPVAGWLKRAVGVDPARRLPTVPAEGFDAWAAREGLHEPVEGPGRKVAYFVGCTARHYFPEVARATVEVLRAAGIGVFVPPDQQCCGMPTYLEGDRPFTEKLAKTNLPILRDCVRAGYDVVSACPTCSFAFKTVLARGARFAPQRRERILALAEEEGGDVPGAIDRLAAFDAAPTGRTGSAAAEFSAPWVVNHLLVRPHAGEGVDDGYFADLDPDLRIEVASHVWELGEYLRDLVAQGLWSLPAGIDGERLGHFPPCHLREQEMGRPWAELLAEIDGLDVTTLGRADDCCGLGGIMGFKTNFHHASLAMGRGLMARTEAVAPDRVVTECLGCRVQFEQMQSRPVAHPVEILADALRAEAVDQNSRR
ncbi:MAG: hypothetical protein LWW93_13430 [Hyphomicrobiales bacterium]|nr:hypothetical protein [Hyphomicrobiales bacterium]